MVVEAQNMVGDGCQVNNRQIVERALRLVTAHLEGNYSKREIARKIGINHEVLLRMMKNPNIPLKPHTLRLLYEWSHPRKTRIKKYRKKGYARVPAEWA